ncbi:MAG: hypothetical protein UX38_C0033G0009 [Microgenomates group bacterium GW2011_GWC1_46_16]|nr:MAG: hypothetical protein UX32_C0012G0007 [Microgenomates group bacterium GW2011_GWF1_46_12]KKU25198.1 MAG: hypothetical protein UX38_C0033G0009 [Microgenomates group bacterium GW2011_GWC1_46_16]KKU27698.1 MAG: hypothetical protein UX40_C0008G0019 [Microgenomates group bacterium GW2011_GWF2_46_18]KKU43348.1 MAG: hypothetical protein UX59_C0021G0006 [Microgenomates group bacterium GW2011_GWA1_46_7]KKU44835.1 MAG: hypothetical protein UX63_C0020G0007 [Microgenomates group bacterium GW2011_GWB1
MKARKETTLAIIIGLAIALLVTGGVLRARKALQKLNLSLSSITNKTGSTANSPDSSTDLFLTLDTLNHTVTDETTINVSGKTLPNTYIAILGEKAEHLIVPNELGVFTQSVTLVKGANTIRITVYQEDGQNTSQDLTVVYTTADL